jgi:sigma-B regulation protein RsbU (phosphoserine phosphatase)
MAQDTPSISHVILDSLHDGLYVCDTDRRIIYWSKSAERITGWHAEEVLGRRCSDGLLCHIDKDGRRLCGEEFCPLHRSMVTDKASTCPVVVFGQTRTGGRVPMMVSVAPIHGPGGDVVGGVETFTDFSESFANLERAKNIQMLSLERNLPQDPRVDFSTFYVPHDMIGGDYFAIAPLDRNQYGFLLADVMGHGIPSALYTMHLSALWGRYLGLLTHPAEFAERLNRDLCRVVRDESFATAICGVLDAQGRTVRFASAGGPPMVVLKTRGEAQQVVASGLPFGMIADVDYQEVEVACAAGDCLLLFTDGAVEIHNAEGRMLGTGGLIDLLHALDYPRTRLQIEPLQEALLRFSDELRLTDDLTLLEIRFAATAY